MIDTELQERANRMEQALKVIWVWAIVAREADDYRLVEDIEEKCREALK